MGMCQLINSYSHEASVLTAGLLESDVSLLNDAGGAVRLYQPYAVIHSTLEKVSCQDTELTPALVTSKYHSLDQLHKS